MDKTVIIIVVLLGVEWFASLVTFGRVARATSAGISGSFYGLTVAIGVMDWLFCSVFLALYLLKGRVESLTPHQYKISVAHLIGSGFFAVMWFIVFVVAAAAVKGIGFRGFSIAAGLFLMCCAAARLGISFMSQSGSRDAVYDEYTDPNEEASTADYEAFPDAVPYGQPAAPAPF
eukprot:m.353993 g.353993  ORF g.353993 m.353993 type:complete len:175 (-) comp16891_c0_seq1:2126-2650(-)